MSLRIDSTQRARVSKIVEQKQNYAVVHLSTSRKDTNGDYKYSDWGFVRVVGKGAQYLKDNVQESDIIVLKNAILTKEPYIKEGETEPTRPKNFQAVIFEMELYRSNSGATSRAKPSTKVELPPEDEIPF